jgi:hypothetical protein
VRVVVCQPIGACVRDSLHRMVRRRGGILKWKEGSCFEKDRGECIGWMSRHVDVVCEKVQVHVYGGVTTVVVVLQIVVGAHDISS